MPNLQARGPSFFGCSALLI